MATVFDAVLPDSTDSDKADFRAYFNAREMRSPKDEAYGPAVGDGITNDYAALAAVDAAVVSNGGAVLCSPGTYLINSDITLSAPWHFMQGAILKPASGITVTIANGIFAGMYQIFDISAGGTITGTMGLCRIAESFGEWWGAHDDWIALGNYTTDNAPAINAAASFMEDIGGGVVRIPGRRYAIESTIWLRDRVGYRGSSRTGTWIIGETADMTMMRVENDLTATASHVDIRDMFLYSATTSSPSTAGLAQRGINFSGLTHSLIDNVGITLQGNSRELMYGEGNTGGAPYRNEFTRLFLSSNNTAAIGTNGSVGVRQRQGANGGSGGGNRNVFRFQHAVALGGVVDMEAGNGCTVEYMNAETIRQYYVRANNVPAIVTGTSTGSNTSTTLNNTNADFVTPDRVRGNTNVGKKSHVLEITSGTGARQWRYIGVVGTTTLTIRTERPWLVTPDATSSYRVTPTPLLSGTVTAGGTTALRMQDSSLSFAQEGVVADTWQVRIISGTGANQTRSVSGTVTTTVASSGTATSASSTTITNGSEDFVSDSVTSGYQVEITSGTGDGQIRDITNVTTTTLTVTPAWDVTPDATSVYSVAAKVKDTLLLNAPWNVKPDGTSGYVVYQTKAVNLDIQRIVGEGESASGPDMIILRPGADGVNIGKLYASSLGGGDLVTDETDPMRNDWPGKLLMWSFYKASVSAGTTTKLDPPVGSASQRGGHPVIRGFAVKYAVVTCGGRTGGTATVNVRAQGSTLASGVFNADITQQMVISFETLTPIATLRNLEVQVVTDGSWSAASAEISCDVYGVTNTV